MLLVSLMLFTMLLTFMKFMKLYFKQIECVQFEKLIYLLKMKMNKTEFKPSITWSMIL